MIKEGPEKAEVRLEDCLACTGCLTTSETILLQEQSINKLIEMIEKDKENEIVLLLSMQSLYSLQKHLKISLHETIIYL